VLGADPYDGPQQVRVIYKLESNANELDADAGAGLHDGNIFHPRANTTTGKNEFGGIHINTTDATDSVVLKQVGSLINVEVGGVVEGSFPVSEVGYAVVDLGNGNDDFKNETSLEAFVDAGDGAFTHNGGNAILFSDVYLDKLSVNAGVLKVAADLNIESLDVDVAAGALLSIQERYLDGSSYKVRIHGSSTGLISNAEALTLWGLAARPTRTLG